MPVKPPSRRSADPGPALLLITISSPVPQPRPGWPSPLPKPCHVLSDLSWPHTNPVKEAGQVLLFPLCGWGDCWGGSRTCSGPPREHTSQLLIRLLLPWAGPAKGIRPSPPNCSRTSGRCRGGSERRGPALPCCTQGGGDSHLFLFGRPSPRPGSRWEGTDWAGAGTACAHAGLFPRRGEACFSEIQGEKLPLVCFSRHGGRRRESRVFLM